jgi:hypothetical protein
MAEQKAWLCNGEPLLLLKKKEMEPVCRQAGMRPKISPANARLMNDYVVFVKLHQYDL